MSADDDLYQLCTSGTTGRPKGAVLTHRAVTANCAQIAALPHRGLPGERSLVAAPLCHAGVVWSAFAPQHWGASLAIRPAVDPSELVRTLDEDTIGYAALVPSILHMCLTDVPDVAARRYRDLRLVHLGSADTGLGRGAGTRLGERHRSGRGRRAFGSEPPERVRRSNGVTDRHGREEVARLHGGWALSGRTSSSRMRIPARGPGLPGPAPSTMGAAGRPGCDSDDQGDQSDGDRK